MPAIGPINSPRPPPSVFLRYASEDRLAAKPIRDGLKASGLEVWYDESGLDGGDAWDQKIRRQIRQCDFFMPLISVQTEARPEGYFRREWRLAVLSAPAQLVNGTTIPNPACGARGRR